MTRQIYVTFAMILLLAVDGYAGPSSDSNRYLLSKGYVHGISMGLLAHDVDNLWSGSKKRTVPISTQK